MSDLVDGGKMDIEFKAVEINGQKVVLIYEDGELLMAIEAQDVDKFCEAMREIRDAVEEVDLGSSKALN